MPQVAKFLKGVNKILDGIRDGSRKVCEEHDLKWDDPLADVRILAGDDCKRSEFQGAEVAITFDGAGYEYLSMNAEEDWACELASAAEEFGVDLETVRKADAKQETHRERLDKLADACGLQMEDYASWAICFYKK